MPHSNPLLTPTELPDFKTIQAEHVEPAITQILQDNRAELDLLLSKTDHYTWDNLMAPLESLEDRLNNAWSPVRHLNAVCNHPELRAAHDACLAKLSDYTSEIGQNIQLFEAIQSIADSPTYADLSQAQQQSLKHSLRDFRLSGVTLDEGKKKRFKAISKALSDKTNKFDQNIMDATQAWSLHIETTEELSGLPEHAVRSAAKRAKRSGKSGWIFSLEFPDYFAIMTFSEIRALRMRMYHAFTTRASDQGPCAGQFDNSQLIEDIVALRHEKAQLLGFENYSAYSLATKMAETPEQVFEFMNNIADKAKPKADQEFAELTAFASKNGGPETLAPWDISFYSERLRQAAFNFSQEDVRPYFPERTVIAGLIALSQQLFGITVKPVSGISTWHKDVQFYELSDASGQVRGQLYMDLYARSHKRGGAWMDECRNRRRLSDGRVQTPVAYLTCNFTPADPKYGQALLTHAEVETLFHEFGHCIHHMLTQVEYADVSGINGVPWDAVELPSQFMENWCWQQSVLDQISGHIDTQAPLPEHLLHNLFAAKHFQCGMQLVRQLEFGLFDFHLHHDFNPQVGAQAQKVLNTVRSHIAVTPQSASNRFQHGFSHIFGGGYAAGYYSYLWAEVLSSDAFSRFEEEGLFDAGVGEDFLHHILERGGSEEPMALFVAFRGREPRVDALLRHRGLVA